MNEYIDVVPVGEVVGNCAESGLVCQAEVLESLVREHHAPTECVVGVVALDYGDFIRRVALFEKQCRVEACRSAPDDRYQMSFSIAFMSEVGR